MLMSNYFAFSKTTPGRALPSTMVEASIRVRISKKTNTPVLIDKSSITR